ncbi:MAG: SufD family Fe-S cluster assembly protein [Neomegalonema sp.]|nr:SufD family Fe-S cluster assembly protein [Neomegalonema sp.]
MADPNAARAALAEQKRALAAALLAETPASDAPSGLNIARAAAAEQFAAAGAPVRRDEYWRFTDPARLTAPRPAASPGAVAGAAGNPFSDVDAATAVFVAGQFRPDLSDDLSVAGLEIATLGQGAPDWASSLIGALESRAQAPVERPLATLTAAAATDGVALRAVGKAAKPLHIQHLAASDGVAAFRAAVMIEEGAEATILESGPGGIRHLSLIEAQIAKGGALDHLRSQTAPNLKEAATHLFGAVADGGVLKSFTLSAANSAEQLFRNETVLWLDGDDVSAHVAGGVVGTGEATIDNTLFLTHRALRGESRQVFKTVLADEAKAVFQGKILVEQAAQKTDGYQISQGVILGERAAIMAKPELEIYADDVKCSHGSTTGALDESALFYLRSRGVPRQAAEAMLIEAFLEEAIEEISDPALQEAMRAEAVGLVAERLS